MAKCLCRPISFNRKTFTTCQVAKPDLCIECHRLLLVQLRQPAACIRGRNSRCCIYSTRPTWDSQLIVSVEYCCRRPRAPVHQRRQIADSSFSIMRVFLARCVKGVWNFELIRCYFRILKVWTTVWWYLHWLNGFMERRTLTPFWTPIVMLLTGELELLKKCRV